MTTLLQNAFWQIGVLPERGASFSFGRVNHAGTWRDLLWPRPEQPATYWDYSSYLLVPWSNRIRDGAFQFEGHTYRLRINCEDHTAIHGAGLDFPWEIDAASDTGMTLHFHAADYAGVNFPWRFEATVGYELQDRRLIMTLTLRNADSTPMPAGFGFHPIFVRQFAGPDDLPLLEVPCDMAFPAVNALPTGPARPVEPRVDFRSARLLGGAFVDDCLTGRQGDKPIHIRYRESGFGLTMQSDPIFQQIIVYDPPEKNRFAVEPVTNANDGFNLYAQGLAGTGVFVLEPGESKSGTAVLALEG